MNPSKTIFVIFLFFSFCGNLLSTTLEDVKLSESADEVGALESIENFQESQHNEVTRKKRLNTAHIFCRAVVAHYYAGLTSKFFMFPMLSCYPSIHHFHPALADFGVMLVKLIIPSIIRGFATVTLVRELIDEELLYETD